jgi:hypothetical protein
MHVDLSCNLEWINHPCDSADIVGLLAQLGALPMAAPA